MSKRIILVRAWAALVAGLVGVGMLAVVPSASAHEGHGHVLLYTEHPAGPWHDEAIAQSAPKVKLALEAAGMTVTLDDDSSEFTDEGLQAGAEGGPREPGELDELVARVSRPAAEQAEELAPPLAHFPAQPWSGARGPLRR